MELTKRKRSRISEFDYGQEGAYFVTLCTQKRAKLFMIELPTEESLCTTPDGTSGTTHRSCPTVANQVIHKWITETENKFFNIVINKYVIMPDHLHLIVTIKEHHVGASLPDVMQFFKTMTTNEYIRGVKKGILPPFDRKLWQKSYYDHVVRNQEDYNEIWEYIENNPAKWMMIYHSEP